MRHEWQDPDTLSACAVEGDPLVGHPDFTVNGQGRAAVFAAREILRLAAERDLYKAELATELTRGAEEIRRLTRDAAECDRELFAEIGAALNCATAALIETPHSVLSLSLRGELLMAAFNLRQDRDGLAARVQELENAYDGLLQEAKRDAHLAEVQQQLLGDDKRALEEENRRLREERARRDRRENPLAKPFDR